MVFFKWLAVASAFAVLALPVTAQGAQRVYVSAIGGNDANAASNCAPTAPCRTFGTAVATVDAGGEVVVLDSGAYGSVTISKSVSLIAPAGVYGGISVFPSADGVLIDTPGVEVLLRGLVINGMGGARGVYMTAGSRLVVDRCVLRNLTDSGVRVATAGRVSIIDTLLQGNATGVRLSDGAQAVIIGTRLLDNTGPGLWVLGGITRTSAEVNDSEASGNGNTGYYVSGDGGGMASLQIMNSVSAHNGGGGAAAWGGTMPGHGDARLSVSNSLFANDENGCEVTATGTGATAVVSGNRLYRIGFALCQGSAAVFESTRDNTILGAPSYEVDGTLTDLAKE